MPNKYKILRLIPEEFTVVAEDFESACAMIGEGQVEDSQPLDDRYEQLEEEPTTWDEVIREALLTRGLPCKPCGLNADWCLSAWHLSPDQPNFTSGHFYLLDTEESDPHTNAELFEIVQRMYPPEDQMESVEDTGNIKTVHGPGTLDFVLNKWTRKEGCDGNATHDGEQQGV